MDITNDNDIDLAVYQDLYRENLNEDISENYASMMKTVSRFVKEAINNNAIPFTCTGKKISPYRISALAKTYYRIINFLIFAVSYLPDEYEYEEEVTVFITSCNSLGGLIEVFYIYAPNTAPGMIVNTDGDTLAEIFNKFVNLIRNEWKIGKYSTNAKKRIRDNQCKFRNYCDYIDNLYKKNAVYLVIRVDLTYLNEFVDTDVKKAKADLGRMLSNRRHNPLFKGLEGYIVKLEYGIKKGVHFHTFWFFNGSVRKKSSHVYLAQEIGEYWKSVITRNRGDYWNSNNNAPSLDKNQRLGIGVIHWHETELINNLKYKALKYLFKTEQFIRPKQGGDIKKFRRGNFLDLPVHKTGPTRANVSGLSKI